MQTVSYGEMVMSSHRLTQQIPTVLYAFNAIGGIFTWIQLHLLVGIAGKSMEESVLEEYKAGDGIFASILEFVPFIVADGLLVRHLFAMPLTFSYMV